MPDQRVLPAKSPAIANDPAVRTAHANNTNTNANSPSSSSSSLSSRLGLSLVIIVSALAILILSALLPMLVDNTGEKSSTLLGSEQSAHSISSSGFNSDSLLLTSSSSSSLSSPAPPSSLPSSLESPPPSSSSPEEIYIIEQNNLNNNDDDYNNNNNNNDTSVMTSTSVVVAATAHDDLNHVPSLPPTTSLSYLAEGAANVIYRLSSSPGEPQYHNKLLRLRKALPSAQPNRLAYAHLLQTFHPLFPDHLLLPTSLIRIPSSILIRENVALRALEAENKRPAKRQGLYLEEVDEEFGFLIMDMSPHPIPTPPSSPSFLSRALSLLPGRRNKRSSDPDLTLPAHAQRTRQLLIEFKPKWVLQSRSAPDSWRRCRTCALRLSKKQKNSFCPLDLSSGEEARVRRAVQYIIPAKQPPNLVLAPGVTWTATQKIIADRIVRYLLEGDLMTSLKKLHNDLDPYGPLAVQTMSQEHKEKFVSAMTVRDLTIFLRIDLDLKEGDKKAVDARIGDLDLKTGDAGKWNYWSGVEKKLRDEGYYAGTEEGAEEKGVWCRP